MFQPRVRNEATDLLVSAILRLETPEDAYRFFEDLCSIPEIEKISQRLHVASLINSGENYVAIASKTGASSATISRVKRALLYGAGGYSAVLEKLSEADHGRKEDDEWT